MTNISIVRTQKILERTHDYRDDDGILLFQKQIFRNQDGTKSCVLRKPSSVDDTKWIYRNVIPKNPPLYKLQSLCGNDFIHIPEGEKDCDTLSALGLIATTNYDGASGKFRSHYAEFLKNKNIILYEDKDEAGKNRIDHWLANLSSVAATVKIWRCPDAMPEHSDVTDYLKTFPDYRTGLERLKQEIESLPFELLDKIRAEKSEKPWLAAKESDRGKHADYVNFIKSLPHCSDMRLDILTNEVMLKINGSWSSGLNEIDYIKTHSRDYGKFFVLERFKESLARAKHDDLKPQLLEDFPSWDGVDRISEIASVLRCDNLASSEIEELIKQWGATVFKRLANPSIQPATLVFIGAQGLGKDALIDALTGGFGGLVKHLSLAGQDFTEARRQLHTGLIFRIDEFDKTAKKDISALKEILTTSTTNERLAYDPRPADRVVRCSFIGSANRDDILIDSSGNRRFWIFKFNYMGLELRRAGDISIGTGKVECSYPGLFGREGLPDERKQIAAQFQALARENYLASAKTLAKINEFSCEQTPESINDLIIQDYLEQVNLLECIPTKTIDGIHYYKLHQISDVLNTLQKNYKKGRNYILNLLKLRGIQVRNKMSRLYSNGVTEVTDQKNDLSPILSPVSAENDLLF